MRDSEFVSMASFIRLYGPFVLTPFMFEVVTAEYRRRGIIVEMTCHVYIIGGESDASPWKIGLASNPHKRLRDLQVGSPKKLAIKAAFSLAGNAEAKIVERTAHLKLAHARSHGEWFIASLEEVMAVVSYAVSILGTADCDTAYMTADKPPNPRPKGPATTAVQRVTAWRNKNRDYYNAYMRKLRAKKRKEREK